VYVQRCFNPVAFYMLSKKCFERLGQENIRRGIRLPLGHALAVFSVVGVVGISLAIR
jgi:hypothetical protein